MSRPSTSSFFDRKQDVDARVERGHDEWMDREDAMNTHDKSRYHEVHARSLADPEGFWAEVAAEIDWIEPAKKIFDPTAGAYGRWFAGAAVNTCYNALD